MQVKIVMRDRRFVVFVAWLAPVFISSIASLRYSVRIRQSMYAHKQSTWPGGSAAFTVGTTSSDWVGWSLRKDSIWSSRVESLIEVGQAVV